MNSAGVSLIAVARPMPMPAQRQPRRSATRSAMIRPKSSRLTWPKPRLSRTGSMAANERHRERDHPPARPAKAAWRAGRSSAAQTKTSVGQSEDDVEPGRVEVLRRRHRQHGQRGERRVGEAECRARSDVFVELAALCPPDHCAVINLHVEEVIRPPESLDRQPGGVTGDGDDADPDETCAMGWKFCARRSPAWSRYLRLT